MLDFHYRHYAQSAASFYADYFESERLYMGRDKELSTFTSSTIGGAISYEFLHGGWRWLDKASFNASLDFIQFDYEDFGNQEGITTPEQIRRAPFYSFSANVLQLYMSVWY